jgi:DNA polymerase-3 subunit delta'
VSVSTNAFASVPTQPEVARLLAGARAEGAAHAYLLHGPAGVGKRAAAFALAGALLGDDVRVRSRAHPDLYVVEALGDMVRIDAIRDLRHDLHMRPFEGDRRVYLILDADRMNPEAADALLKDLEEPPAYATIVLVADELGPLPETIRSRCQLIPFRRLPEAVVRAWLEEQAPELSPEQLTAFTRTSGGRLDRAARMLDPDAADRRDALLGAARAVYLEDVFDPAAAAATVLAGASARGAAAKEREADLVDGLTLPAKEGEQRVRRAQRGAERDELLASLEELAAWFRDLVVVAAGAEPAAVNADRVQLLREDATPARAAGAERAAELVRDAWRTAREFNVNPALALEALFIRLRRELYP